MLQTVFLVNPKMVETLVLCSVRSELVFSSGRSQESEGRRQES
jgi:hypothetical protein